MWPWGACWLQDEACQGIFKGPFDVWPWVWRVQRFKEGFKGWQTAGLDAHKKPLMCGLGVPVGCRMKHAKGLFKRPIRSH